MVNIWKSIINWIKRLLSNTPEMPNSEPMIDGGDTPFIHKQAIKYYEKFPADRFDDSEPIVTLADHWSTVYKVNKDINSIPYLSESIDAWGDGHDCEDYAIEKRRELVTVGIPRNSMRLACAYTEADFYHAVLAIFAEEGVYILDNRLPAPTPWKEVPYKGWWVERADGTWMIVNN